MKFILKITIFFAFTICISKQQKFRMLCNNDFCQEYKLKQECPGIPVPCQIQNATHNGIFLSFPGPCNCCKYCIENLALDDSCIVGSPDSPPPSVICGAGLTCEKNTGTCASSPTECMNAQIKFDEDKHVGKVGHMQLRPQCDRQGYYEPVKCVPGEICYCVDKSGHRLFGEMPYSPLSLDITKCECSRSIATIDKVLQVKSSLKRARCLSNGNFDRLQCLDNYCICVDAIDGKPSYPNKKPLYISVASQLPCFDKTIHVEGIFYKQCQKELYYAEDLVKTYKSEGFDDVIGVYFPNCQLDGMYSPAQENITHKYCVDPEGNILNDYVLEKTKANAKLMDTMNCYCARSQLIITGMEKPVCCENGNFKTMQCRRGKCRCVDENGAQIKKEFILGEEANPPCNENQCTQIIIS